jgi:hypothetical protein
MAHYAFLNDNNVVTEVIVGVDETEFIDGKSPEVWYSELRGQRCVRTSYNSNIRKNFAGLAYSYDEALDAFIPPQHFASWTLDEDTCQWRPPVPQPATGNYVWDEDTTSWVELIPDTQFEPKTE